MSSTDTDTPDQGRPKRRSPWLRLLFVLFLVAVGSGFVVALAALIVYQHVTQPGIAGKNVAVEIPEGATGRDIGQILVEHGLLEHELLFRLAVHLDTSKKPVKYGFYNLPQGLSPRELLHILQEGPNRAPTPGEMPPELRPTIPEGLSISQAAQLFDEPEAFIAAASDAALMARMGLKTRDLEGFLMPDTYFFSKKPSAREVVERMVAQFERKYAELTAQYPPRPGFDKLAIVTIASLVEEEARVPEERPLIAAVIYNRIEKKMPLQLDSTLQYALKKYGQRLLYEDREVESPYNTYKYTGLPPGPISSPGVDSIKAALAPAPVDYLYFVSNADGRTHTFSATMGEHVKAVNKFRQEIAPQRKAQEEQQKKR